MEDALAPFSPAVRDWFLAEVGEPTDVQHLAWPRIAAGEHVLVAAPTGSGKTLTAFLWALDRLLGSHWQAGGVRVLYVSPLKALNNDIQRNLLTPLEGLTHLLETRGLPVPSVRVMTRSGDTPQNERQRMIRRPPEILITTPESLNLMLTSRGGRSILGGVESVILDEIHAVAGGKRGTHLITAVERLALLSGEFQRVALSATARPLERIAAFVGGYQQSQGRGENRYTPRPVAVVQSVDTKRYELSVTVAPGDPRRALKPDDKGGMAPDADELWTAMCDDFRNRIARNRSTLVFANSRRTTEKVTRFINRDAGREIAYSHHGSLSREIRSVVEARLKAGELAAIVATNSLELGIDIGALDEVLLVQTPPSIASAIQRLGRAGHQVGAVSRGRLYPLFDRDFIDAAVVAESVLSGQIEELTPILTPLDVLAQVILSMVCAETWQVDELFDFLRTSYPYHSLTRRSFDLVIEMLSGRYAATRIRELEPQLRFDAIDGTLEARRGTARRLYMSGGTIPDRGYFQLRTFDTRTKIGELDEEFVWERSLGDSFTLGAQSWRVRQITHNDVLVGPSPDGGAMAPFWRAEERDRSFFLSSRLGEFLERAEAWLAEGGRKRSELREILAQRHCLSGAACDHLLDLLDRQRAATQGLPHRHHQLIEHLSDPASKTGETQAILHTLWGGRVNRPYAMALATAWQDATGTPLRVEADNDCIAITLPHRVQVSEVLELVAPDDLEVLLRRCLEGTGFFGARFRENAGRALLLPRSDFRRRVPLWLTRERSKKLLDSVRQFDDFPIVVETWRSCLQDDFDLDSLKIVLGEIADGRIRRSEVRVAVASPLAQGLVWRMTNRLMYEDDTPEGAASSRVRPDLLAELALSSALRPKLPQALIETLDDKLKRVFPGYAPREAAELLEWVKERSLIPASEWQELLAAIDRDRAAEPETADPNSPSAPSAAWLVELGDKLLAVTARRADFVCARESYASLDRALGLSDEEREEGEHHDLPTWCSGLLPVEFDLRRLPLVVEPSADDDGLLSAWLGSWLRFYGPRRHQQLLDSLPVSQANLAQALEELAEDAQIVVDRFRAIDDRLEVCDRENLERLLRLLRSSRRVSLPTRPVAELPLFLADFQGLTQTGGSVESLQEALEQLLGYPAPAASWEDDLLPARLDPYLPSWLDSLLQDSDLSWLGCGEKRLTFVFPEDRELLGLGESLDESTTTTPADSEAPIQGWSRLHQGTRMSLEELAQLTELPSGQLQDEVWSEAWQGRLSNTTFAAVRRGLLQRFRAPTSAPPAPQAGGRTSRARSVRHSARRWHQPTYSPGDWFRWPSTLGDAALDPLDLEERNKERARLLLDRYGIVFRELLSRETEALAWSPIFRALRMMELSGEVTSGLFFTGIGGLQFTSRAGLRRLREGLPEDAIYWMSALDPAAPSGLGLTELTAQAPARLRSNHLVYHGSRLVVVSKRNGADLTFEVAEDHPHLERYLGFMKAILLRPSRSVHTIDVETINQLAADESPYRSILARLFEATRTSKGLRLRKRFDGHSV